MKVILPLIDIIVKKKYNINQRRCLVKKVNDLIGKKFNKLTVIDRGLANSKRREVMWVCQCECGKTTQVSTDDLKNGHNKSCGCLRHELSRTRIYDIWQGMNRRCYDKNTREYKRYGGRGIAICDEWKNDFISFYNWAMENGYQENLTIDRIDNNGDYKPDNCRWITNAEQCLNRRTNRYVTYNEETKTISQWAKEKNLKFCTLSHRLDSGWSVEKALNLPVNFYNKKKKNQK